jgi:hypothetical protein
LRGEGVTVVADEDRPPLPFGVFVACSRRFLIEARKP